tara:strand:+ start:18985 stop:19308 length:324 start_codon:yes stop_codon:yes gene_type:complete
MEESIRHLYSLLCSSEYSKVYWLTSGNRLSVEEMGRAISEYGDELIPYPEEIQLDVIEILNTSPKAWSVTAPVYTQNEGLSDLSIELTATENSKGSYVLSLDDIRVL